MQQSGKSLANIPIEIRKGASDLEVIELLLWSCRIDDARKRLMLKSKLTCEKIVHDLAALSV